MEECQLPERLSLTARDLEILDALTRRVRVLTLPQIARTWWITSKLSEQSALARLRLLEESDFVTIKRSPAHPELPLTVPVYTWDLGATAPDSGALAYKLQSRWNEHPVSTVCVSATPLAARRFSGAGGRPPRQVELVHDIHLARVYLLYRAQSPDSISGWIFEDQLRRERKNRSERLPDAILNLPTGPKVIEFGGAYPKAKLEAFHAYCKERDFPYEIW